MGEAELSSSGSGTDLEVRPLVPQDKPQTQPAEPASLHPGGPQPAVPRGSVPGGRRQEAGSRGGGESVSFLEGKNTAIYTAVIRCSFLCVKARRHLRVANELKASLLHTHNGFTQYSPPLGFYPRDGRPGDRLMLSPFPRWGHWGRWAVTWLRWCKAECQSQARLPAS